MLKISNVTKIYHNKYDEHLALDNINIEIKENHGLVFLLGPSGSGKSTLLNIIADIDLDYSGQKEIDGKLVYIFQDFRLFDSMSLIDNLLIIEKDINKINNYLKDLNLYDIRKRKVYKLSNGQKKRLELIKALLLNPDILLLDEITSALDFDNCQKVMSLLCEFSKTILVIMVTHDEDLINNYQADEVIRLEDGKIINDTKNYQNKSTHKNEYIKLIKDIKDHLILIFKDLKSRFIYYTIFMLVVVLSITAIYTSISLYKTINEQNKLQNIYKYGRNIVHSTHNKKLGNNDHQRGSFVYNINKYDLYYPDDINEFIKNNPDIKAIETAFTPEKNKDFYFNTVGRAKEGKMIFLIHYLTHYLGQRHNQETSFLNTIGAFKNVYYKYDQGMGDEFNNYITENLIYKTSFKQDFQSQYKTSSEYDDNFLLNYPLKNRAYSMNVLNIHPHATPFLLFDDERISLNQTIYSPHYLHLYDFNGQKGRLYDDYSLHFYHLVNGGTDLNLIYGEMPKNENEIILDNNAATKFAKYYGIDQKDLVGKEINLGMYGNSILNSWSNIVLNDKNLQNLKEIIFDQFDFKLEDLFLERFSFKIVGISSLKITDKRVAFTTMPFDDNVFLDRFTTQVESDEYKEFHQRNDYYNYPFLYEGKEIPKEQVGSIYFDTLSFICDPKADIDKIYSNTISYFKPQYDSFDVYADNLGDTDVFYKNINIFFPFLLTTTLIIILTPFITLNFSCRRNKKENDLMINYGYRAKIIYLFKFIIFSLISSIISTIIIYLISLKFNEYALSYNYSSFLDFNILYIILISVLVILSILGFKKVVSR